MLLPEHALHEHFRVRQMRGEWFRDSRVLQCLVGEVIAANDAAAAVVLAAGDGVSQPQVRPNATEVADTTHEGDL